MSNPYSQSAYVDPDTIEDLDEKSSVTGVPASSSAAAAAALAGAAGAGGVVDTHKHNVLDIKYKTSFRARPAKPEQLAVLADLPVKLVPIRIDVEIEGNKLRDTFTWNMNETLMTPEYFAQLLADDMDCPYAAHFIQPIAEAIRKQVVEYAPVVEEDPVPRDEVASLLLPDQTPDDEPSEDAPVDDMDDFAGYSDSRVVIKLDLHVGSMYLKDQFEWPLYSSLSITPEDFARQLSADLGVGGEFVPMIAHAIREQVLTARLNSYQAIQPARWRVRPFRNEDLESAWQPDLRILTDEEIDRMAKEEDRNSRRLRRQRQQITTLGRSSRRGAAVEMAAATLQPNIPVFSHPPTLVRSRMCLSAKRHSLLGGELMSPDGGQQDAMQRLVRANSMSMGAGASASAGLTGMDPALFSKQLAMMAAAGGVSGASSNGNALANGHGNGSASGDGLGGTAPSGSA
ncbi:hypothetical protein BC831DRAFT_433950 [Entophlyctis helioformis]|nr:hypothetical protein BC831DRAFT_433950 [Entophlyctis helioformis]